MPTDVSINLQSYAVAIVFPSAYHETKNDRRVKEKEETVFVIEMLLCKTH